MKLSDDAKQNIKAAFGANPKVNTFFADVNGHCFENGGSTPNDTVIVTREEFETETEKAPEEMTANELKQALTDLNVEFDSKATKAALLELLLAEKAKS
jgi:hypothetical protein